MLPSVGRSSETRTPPQARSRGQRAGALLASGLSGAALLVGSCHAFSDLAPPGDDERADRSAPDALAKDADASAELPGLVTMTEAVRICSKVLTCPHVGPSITASFGLPIDSANFSQCVHTLGGPIDPRRINALTTERLRCLANADACNVGACVVREEIDPADPRIDPACADGGKTERCAGETRMSCLKSNLGGWAIHCDDPVYAAGSRCVVADGVSRCDVTVSGCPLVVQAQCVDGTEPLSVSDYCYDAGGAVGHTKTDCRASGRGCQAGVPGCAGQPCAIHLHSQCDGATRLSVCIFDQLATLDCAPTGAKSACKTHDNAAYCSGPHDECSPYDPQPAGGQGVNSCSGTSINLCVGGRLTSVDCRLAGAEFDCRTGSAPKSNYCGPMQ